MSLEKVERLAQVKHTIAELLRDRGYNVPTSEMEMPLDAFINKYGENPEREILFGLYRKKESQEQIFVFFPKDDSKPVGVKTIEDYYKRMKAEGVSRSLVILPPNGITPFAKQCVVKMPKGLITELFSEEEMLVNITHHNLVPKHQLLTDDEKKAVLDKYKLKPTQLPRIQVTDPVARYFGLQKGQVVKIIRPSETAGRYVTYRLVV